MFSRNSDGCSSFLLFITFQAFHSNFDEAVPNRMFHFKSLLFAGYKENRFDITAIVDALAKHNITVPV